MYVLSCDPSGTSKILPLCVAFVKVTLPSDKLTGPSPRVVTSVIAPVEEFLLIVLRVLSDLIGPENVVLPCKSPCLGYCRS